MYFVLQEESTMEEYLNKSKISGDIFRFLYLNKQSFSTGNFTISRHQSSYYYSKPQYTPKIWLYRKCR